MCQCYCLYTLCASSDLVLRFRLESGLGSGIMSTRAGGGTGLTPSGGGYISGCVCVWVSITNIVGKPIYRHILGTCLPYGDKMQVPITYIIKLLG